MLFVAALTAVLGGCRTNEVVESPDGVLVLGRFEETATETRSLALSGRTLIIEAENGAVSLSGVPGNDVDLTFSMRARGESRDAAQKQLDQLLLEESGDEISYSFDIQPDDPARTNVDVTGTVPRNAEVRLILRSGNVTLSNLDGRINVLLENGDISFLGGSASVSLATRNGDVAGDFYRLSPGSSVELATTNGDVTLGLSEGVPVVVSGSTRAGYVRTDGFTFDNPRLSVRGAGARFSGSSGSEGATINMKTQNGDLRFHRSQLTAPMDDLPPSSTEIDETPDMPADSAQADPKSIERRDSVVVESADTLGLAPAAVDTLVQQ